MAIEDGKFWIIINLDGQAPYDPYPDRPSAEQAAEALSIKHPGKKFTLCEAVSLVFTHPGSSTPTRIPL